VEREERKMCRGLMGKRKKRWRKKWLGGKEKGKKERRSPDDATAPQQT
jgi:hypothetical protein